MKAFVLLWMAVWVISAGQVQAQNAPYDPAEYTMTPEAEIALARSAAPDNISGHATIKILAAAGYREAVAGDNGFTCIVMRGWSVPFVRKPEYYGKRRAPICYDPVATRTVLPYQELCAKLGLQGKDVESINREVALAYALGELPKIDTTAFAYMWSADQLVGAKAGHWHPHMMVYAPYYTNAMLGGNTPGGLLPYVTADEGTPFAVVVIAVSDAQAIKAKLPAGAN
ncbi:MAG: hypothetical protein JST79_18945 [Acidobacteria bacterium]|nr:hypothetical protein [Acidobacteriota bacterium]